MDLDNNPDKFSLPSQLEIKMAKELDEQKEIIAEIKEAVLFIQNLTNDILRILSSKI
tara:strand:- start:1118 stop:1288 length:171 start_codon:yes stop_codon:yes gene_type:complete